MVARGAGAAGPVLPACRQWDPLGLARRLPSLGVGAWRSAPLLPWRVQCPIRVCTALAAGSGGSGRYLVLSLSRFPLPDPRVPRCVWRAVPSGCPLPSLAGTPFHAVCAFRELGPVALLVVPACPLRLCALALPRRPLPPPLGGGACAPRAVPALGAGRAVPRGPCPSACPTRSLAPSGVLGGGRSGPGSPLPGLGLYAPRGGGGRASPGGCLSLLRGASDARRSPSPNCPLTERAVGVHYPRALGAGVLVSQPNAVPSACMPCGGYVPRGWRVAVPGGGAFHRCEGRLRSGAPPFPTARPVGGLLRSATHVLRARACGCGGPSRSPWPACPVGAACREGGGGPSPGGSACHRCEERLVSSAVPPPAARPLGRAAGVPPPVCPGCGRCGLGTQHQPHSVRPCGLALLAVGVAKGRSRWAAFHRCEGRLWSGAPPPRTAGQLGGLLGSPTHVLRARCWGPTLSPCPACPVGAACRGGGGGPSPGGMACRRCEGRLVSGAVPPRAARPLGRAAGVLRPVCPGCGRCRRGDPAPAPQRAPLRASVARCGGGGRASPAGVPSTVVRGVCGQALPLPRLPAHWAGRWGPPPTCCGRGCVGVGAQHDPLGLHALWGLRAAGVVGGRPRGGWPATVVRGVWCQALSLPWLPFLWGEQPGFRNPFVPDAVGAGVGTQHRPHSVRPCGPALLAVAVAEWRPRGGVPSTVVRDV